MSYLVITSMRPDGELHTPIRVSVSLASEVREAPNALPSPYLSAVLEGYLEGYQRTASPRPEGELLPIAYRIAPLNGRLR